MTGTRSLFFQGVLIAALHLVATGTVAAEPMPSDAWFAAVGRGDIATVRAMVSAGATVDVPSRVLGRTALILAASFGHGELCQVLLDAGASVEARESRTGRTALHYAARSGFRDIVDLLRQRGANPKRRDELSGLDAAGFALMGGHDALARELAGTVHVPPPTAGFASPPSPPVVHRPEGRGEPEAAVARPDSVAATRHVSAPRSDSPLRSDDDGETLPLAWLWDTAPAGGAQGLLDAAVFEGVRAYSVAAVDSALAAGGRVDGRDWDGFTPLFLAVLRNDSNMVRALLERGAVAETRDRVGWTPLLHAAWKGYASIVRILVNHGALVEARGVDSSTALHLAAERNHYQAIETLIDLGSRVNLRTRDNRYVGWTPLMIAAARGNDVSVGYLLRAGAKPNLRGQNGWTALKAAFMNYRTMAAEILRMHGAEM